MIDVSVLVCTRNRRERLAMLLASIGRAAASAPDVATEAIVVDNGSTDGTDAVLADWIAAAPFPVTIVAEPRPGLARARNAGLDRARGRIVAMTDDDCTLRPDYLAAVGAGFAGSRGPAIVGGRILLGDPGDAAVTVKLEDHPMALPRDVFPGGFVMGANLALTRDALARVGRFDERFGAGARFASAEDTDYLLRAARLGITIGYDPHCVVFHHHGRREDADVVRLLAGYAFGDGALFAKHLGDRRVVNAIVSDLAGLRRDLLSPGAAHACIRRFHAFRLRHAAAGFAAYVRDQITPSR